MLVYQKTMFDCYYCIMSFCHLKTLEKCLEKFFFVLLYKHEGFVGFEKACTHSKDLRYSNVISMYVTVDDVNFCDNQECLYVKYKSCSSKARELPD